MVSVGYTGPGGYDLGHVSQPDAFACMQYSSTYANAVDWVIDSGKTCWAHYQRGGPIRLSTGGSCGAVCLRVRFGLCFFVSFPSLPWKAICTFCAPCLESSSITSARV